MQLTIYKKIIFVFVASIIIGSLFAPPVLAQSYCWTKKACSDAKGQYVEKDASTGLKATCVPNFAYCYPTETKVKLQVPIGKLKETGSLSVYIPTLYNYAVSIVSIVAIVMIMIGGLKYLTAGGSAERVSSAKETILGAVVGLLLVLGSYVMLQTINPRILSFKLTPPKMIAPSSVTQWCPEQKGSTKHYKCGDDYKKADNPEIPADCTGGYCSGVGNISFGCNKLRIFIPDHDDIIYPPQCMPEYVGKVFEALNAKRDKCGQFKKRNQCVGTPDSELVIPKSVWSKYNTKSSLVAYLVGRSTLEKLIISVASKIPGSEFILYKDDKDAFHISMCSPKTGSIADSVCGPSAAYQYLANKVLGVIQTNSSGKTIIKDPGFIDMLKEVLNVK